MGTFIYNIAMNPHVQEKMYQEIQEKVAVASFCRIMLKIKQRSKDVDHYASSFWRKEFTEKKDEELGYVR